MNSVEGKKGEKYLFPYFQGAINKGRLLNLINFP